MRNERVLAGAFVIVLGILALIVGVIYLTVEAKSLPSFLGQLHGYTGHRSKRGIAALVVGVVLLLVGGSVAAYRQRT
jgi:amino acid permease